MRVVCLRALVCLSLLAFVLACENQPLISQDVLFGKCYKLINRDCVVEETQNFEFWVKSIHTNQTPKVYLDGKAIKAERMGQSGHLFNLSEFREGTIYQLSIQQFGAKEWRLNLHAQSVLPILSEVEKSIQHEPEETILSNLKSPNPLSDNVTYGLEAIGNHYRKAGDFQQAIAVFERARSHAQRLGDHQNIYKLSAILVYLYLNQLPDYMAAEEAIESMSNVRNKVGHQIFLHYNKALLLKNQGRFKQAKRELEQALLQATNLGQTSFIGFVKRLRLLLLTETGQYQLADKGYKELELLAKGEQSCERVAQLINHGWNQLLALKRGIRLEDPIVIFEKARIMNSETCGDKKEANILLVNIAVSHWLNEDRQKAEEILNELSQSERTLSFWSLVDILELRAKIAKSHGQFKKAETQYQQLDQLANQVGDRYVAWLALSGRVELEIETGNLDQYSAIDRLFDLQAQQMLNIQLSGDRFAFKLQFRRYYEGIVEKLLGQSANHLALYILRNLRVIDHQLFALGHKVNELAPDNKQQWSKWLERFRQHNSRLEQLNLDNWGLSLDNLNRVTREFESGKNAHNKLMDEAYDILAITYQPDVLTELTSGELNLAYFQQGNSVIGFAYKNDYLKVHHFLPSKPLASRRLLAPFIDELKVHDKVRLVVDAQLEHLNIHWEDLGSSPLATQKDVVYGHDIKPLAKDYSQSDVLLIADPNDDLAFTRKEIELAKASIDSTDALTSEKITVLLGGQATKSETIDKLMHSQFFHFAGHGEVDLENTLHSFLGLSQNGRLRISDILTLKQSPRDVILSACYSDNTILAKNPNLIGLAQAFLISGSENVLASNGLLPDQVAYTFSKAFYRHLDGKLNVRETTHKTLSELYLSNPELPWEKYRLYVR